MDSGVDVVDIGLVGTEEVYHATFALGVDGGIMVTASHNPREYNGMKFTREQARPISSDTGLLEIEEMVREAMSEAGHAGEGPPAAAHAPPRRPGRLEHRDMRPAFVEHLLTYIDQARAAAAQGRGQPRERRRRAGHRHAGGASAFTAS